MVARVGFGLLVLRRGSALCNPVSEQRDLFRRESVSFRRHAFVWIARSDAQQQRTSRHVIGQDDRAVFATATDGFTGVETQFGLLLERGMTSIAASLEQRLD